MPGYSYSFDDRLLAGLLGHEVVVVAVADAVAVVVAVVVAAEADR